MNIILLLLFVFLILNNIFQSIIPGLNYLDEALTIFALYLYIVHPKGTVLNKYDKNITKATIVVLLIGIISTYCYHIQPNFSGIWRDFLAIIKFPLCYCIYNNYVKVQTKEMALKYAISFSRVFISILFVCGLINLIHHIPLFNDGERYGLPIYGFLYSHNTFMITAIIGMIGILMADGITKHTKTILYAVIVLILSLRSKALPIAFLVLFILILKHKNKYFQTSKIKFWSLIIISALIAIYFSIDRINEYIYYANMSARGALYIFGIDVANRFFPLGSGFCTFASYLSGLYYSPLYYEYGMQGILGLTEDDISFSADTFWPNIYGQYGYIGFAAYLMMLYYFFKSLNARFLYFSDKWLGSMILMLYALSASTAEAFFTNDSAVIFAIILSIYLGKDTKYENFRNFSVSGPRGC